ncbi:calreticulin [Capsaspora owczarzaki ATCC 30864]|uniref:Calreticulin n=1 Tax=Capsaspora owczarzaki (strain ATCC 30864) TaxID=595528 RepID=A0A0D2UPY0_CAPO3|nr:calreticulin [Capsaspora owczarzaki ATCC 30864]KJE97051.1 calreticulin [Capsaspora owczarzaki ATCC 30864]|eukprot:XP_004343409.1 calreticulin [Capsaspora owczarzaki ATCC 30864]
MRSTVAIALLVLLGVHLSNATSYFTEEFSDAGWEGRWVLSKAKGAEQGAWKWTAGKFFNDEEVQKGIQTAQDARFYGISAKLDTPASNAEKPVIIQFQVKHEQKIDCGGGYVKVFGSDLSQTEMVGDTPYHIMFGPDICGSSTKRVHVIFNYKGVNHLIKKTIPCKDDELSHVYTLVLNPDQTYEVLIDLEKVESGSLEADWDMVPPKTILDPEAKKPSDWDDRRKIDDETDSKPADWDKPEFIPDADARKPEDWDDEVDGEWEPAQIPNPQYKGEWKARQIDNPKYKGEWEHPKIDNPAYSKDESLGVYTDLGAVGFDLWQVKAGSIFDNVYVGDSLAEAKAFAEKTWKVNKDGELKAKEAIEKKEREEREAAEAKRKAEEAAADEEEDDDEKDEL